MKILRYLPLYFCFLLQCATHAADGQSNLIEWLDWSPSTFEKAKTENRLIILDLEAVWCHWCHVMAKTTYQDKKVIALLKSKFVAMKVDQDQRPDVSKRYEDYGWPATIFFDSSGRELAKRSGYFPPEEMVLLLEKLIKNPTAEIQTVKKLEKIPDSPYLSNDLKAKLIKSHQSLYDSKLGGWGDVHKFLSGDTEEWALRSAWGGDKGEEKKIKFTLIQALQLIDPVWGGVYQYSVENWKEPHFEKIAEAQQKNLLLYSLAYRYFEEPKFLQAALAIRGFLNQFLKAPKGGYFTSQDADLIRGVHSDGYFKLSNEKRRAQGIPIIDTHQYTRENAWFISGLCELYKATAEGEILKEALSAAEWVEKNRSLEGGGLRHDEKDPAGPYLADTMEMGSAYLNLYESTGDRSWLKKAEGTLEFIQKHFSYKLENKFVGFISSAGTLGANLITLPDRQENAHLARFSNLAFHYTGNKFYRTIAEQAMRYIAIPSIANEIPAAAVLLADKELTEGPIHLTVVGPKGDPQALALFQAALKYPHSYKRIEWWDKNEGPMPNSDVQYPSLPKAAVFACTGGRCSLPFTDPKILRTKIDKLYH